MRPFSWGYIRGRVSDWGDGKTAKQILFCGGDMNALSALAQNPAITIKGKGAKSNQTTLRFAVPADPESAECAESARGLKGLAI